MRSIKIAPDLEWYYLGPDIEKGPLPVLFYFALSAEESLQLHPYNQLALFLTHYPMRIFSITLPCHGAGVDPTKALPAWAEKIRKGESFLSDFFTKTIRAIHYLIQRNIIVPKKTALAGLSRGAFIATHLAARMPDIHYLLGFAPLTQLTFSKDFEDLQENPLATSLNLIHQIPSLLHTKIRYYIGNHDTLVGTEIAFQFVQTLANSAYEQRIRSPQVELLIGPSIGHKGHGTSTASFQEGAHWIAKQLEIACE